MYPRRKENRLMARKKTQNYRELRADFDEEEVAGDEEEGDEEEGDEEEGDEEEGDEEEEDEEEEDEEGPAVTGAPPPTVTLERPIAPDDL
jgi:hypothetical protein